MGRIELQAFSITSDYERITSPEVFPSLLKVLMAYTFRLIGTGTVRLEKGRDELAYDFAMETIKRHLENPTKFNPERNPDIVKYLKFNILRRLVTNFKELKGQSHELAYYDDDPIGMKVTNSFITDIDIHEAIDLKQTIRSIERYISDDQLLMDIFNLRFLMDYTRAETIGELGITPGEYNNRIRRLDTVFKSVIKMQS